MVKAREIIEEAKGALAATTDEIRGHPAAAAIEAGRADRSALQFFLRQPVPDVENP